MSKDDKKEGLFRRVENIKDTNLTQLQAIKDQGEKQLKELKSIDKNKTLKAIDEISKKNNEANKLLSKFKKTDRIFDKAELVSTKTDGTKYDFNRFALPLKFIEKIHNYEITLDEAIEDQAKLNNSYTPRTSKKKKGEKNCLLESARKLPDAKDDIIDLFEKGVFPHKDNVFKRKEEESEEESEGESKKERAKIFIKYIENESKGINYELVKKHFNFVVPSALVKQLYKTKNKNDKL